MDSLIGKTAVLKMLGAPSYLSGAQPSLLKKKEKTTRHIDILLPFKLQAPPFTHACYTVLCQMGYYLLNMAEVSRAGICTEVRQHHSLFRAFISSHCLTSQGVSQDFGVGIFPTPFSDVVTHRLFIFF